MEQDLFSFPFEFENIADVEPTYESLRRACDLFKRSDEIKITRTDDHTLRVEGPYEELALLSDGFFDWQ